jgi:hypothetical protein
MNHETFQELKICFSRKKVENQFFLVEFVKKFWVETVLLSLFWKKSQLQRLWKILFFIIFQYVRAWPLLNHRGLPSVVDGRQQAIEGHGVLLPSHHLHRKKSIFEYV